MSTPRMTRRDFIAAVMATTALSRTRVAAQTSNRAAIVIGVNRCGGLPVLRAAASGAREVGRWLRGEGFEVQEFVDESSPVLARPIHNAVAELVNRGTLEQLVIYFSGHGVNTGFSELWFLTEAPTNLNEAISLNECIALARGTAIPNVVFISDACRSTAESLGASRVRGQIVFPNVTPGNVRVNVDRFYAALLGDQAFETAVGDSVDNFEGIFTGVLLDAFRFPDPQMVSDIGELRVVKNRNLGGYLSREVPARARQRSLQLRQHPDWQVESEAYIGRVRPGPPAGDPRVGGPRPATITDVAGVALNDVGVSALARGGLPREEIEPLARTSGFRDIQATILQVSARTDVPRHFETQTGIIVHGAQIERVVTTPQIQADVLNPGDGFSHPAVVRLETRPGSVILIFGDGTGTVIPSLPQYLATVVVENGGVANVSFVPSRNSYRWEEYEENASRIENLRAAVAAAARFGVFRIEGTGADKRSRAGQLADRIRMLKSVDPALGLYAAYAYWDAGYTDQVQSVDWIMRDNTPEAGFFDVAMLAGSLRSGGGVVPFSPLLSQGWGLLRVQGVDLPAELDEAMDHRLPALWTTFDREGIRLVEGFARLPPR